MLNNLVQWKYSFNVKKQLQLYVTIQLSLNSFNVEKTVLFQTIQLSISTQFKCNYGLTVKNIFILRYSV